MIEISDDVLKKADSFEYNLIHTKNKNKGSEPPSDDVFYHIQNNLIERHGKGFDNKLVRPSALYDVKRTTKPIVADTMNVDEFEDDEIFYNVSDDSYFRYYIKDDRFLEFIDNIYDRYINTNKDLVMYYTSTFSTTARDKGIDLTDFEDVSNIPKIHNFLIRGYRGTI